MRTTGRRLHSEDISPPQFERARIEVSDTRGASRRIATAVVLGARPNVPKVTVVCHALALAGIPRTLIHSGQHPAELGATFAASFGLEIDIQLRTPAGRSDSERTGWMLSALGNELTTGGYRTVIVVGDVNTTVAAALPARRNGLQVVHLEAGLRSNDEDDPEEINRKVVTDCAHVHLASTSRAVENLRAEGIPSERIFFVGNAMAEAYLKRAPQRAASDVLARHRLEPGYLLFTVHKTPTTRDLDWLARLVEVAGENPRVVFPCHPSLRRQWPQVREIAARQGIAIIEPQPYDDLGRLLEQSACVVTDSAGLQEEATMAGVPCVTVGAPTARPETCLEGTNTFVGFDLERCRAAIARAGSTPRTTRRPDRWDEHVSERIARVLPRILAQTPTRAGSRR